MPVLAGWPKQSHAPSTATPKTRPLPEHIDYNLTSPWERKLHPQNEFGSSEWPSALVIGALFNLPNAVAVNLS